MVATKITANYPTILHDILNIIEPSVCWKTICDNFYQLTAEIPGIPDAPNVPGVPTIPATYRGWVKPIDLNDLGAKDADIDLGYTLMDYFTQAFTIIAINKDDKSIDVSDDLLCGYSPASGREGIVYNTKATIIHPNPPNPPNPPNEINWRLDVTCERDSNGDCTGLEVGWNYKQEKNPITGLFEDTGDREPISRINYQACPLPYIPPIPRKAYTTVGKSYDQSIEREISPYANGLQITNVQAPGTNRQYFSIPFDRNLTVRNQVKQITYNKTTIQDNRPGYIDNYIWESSNMFATTNSTTFYITIS